MARPVGIGKQDFEKVIKENVFYVDKTLFIKEWWENKDDVTVIARPRRFGKTLTLDMVEKFFSIKYAERGDLFEGLAIWQSEEYQRLQGTYPVISLSFASIKENCFYNARRKICYLLTSLYSDNHFLIESGILTPSEKVFLKVFLQIWEMRRLPWHSMSCQNIYSAIMGRRRSSCWMNMIRRCRRHMYMGTGKKWWSLPGACSIRRSRQTLTSNVRL